MSDENEYTIRQIAELGLEKYKVYTFEYTRDTMIDAIRKRISKIIVKENIQSSGFGKSTSASKRPARTYSSDVKNKLLDVDLFDYFVELSQDEAVKKYVSPAEYEKKASKFNGKFEDATLDFLNRTHEERFNMMENQENSVVINEYGSLIREKKKEIMLEALFSKFYSLNMEELVEDANKVNYADYYKQEELDMTDMRVFERFNNWQSYVIEKQSD